MPEPNESKKRFRAPSRRAAYFLTGAMALVALLAVSPSTGWLVRTEFRMLAQGNKALGAEMGYRASSDEIAERNKRDAALAQRFPSDFDFALTSALDNAQQSSDTSDQTPLVNGIRSARVRVLLPLRAQFGNQVALHAHILRFLCLGDLKMGRTEADDFLSPPRTKEAEATIAAAREKAKPDTTTPEALSLALDAADNGARLDPTNGYFPTMRAAALLADHQDAAAIQALHRAAACPKWEDYSGQEVTAHIRLRETTEGQTGAVARLATQAALLFPHYARMRSLARTTTYLAAQKEIAGDTEGGFSLRMDTARVGALMRSQSRWYIGNLVGIAITAITQGRPEGTPVLRYTNDAERKADTANAASKARYIAYLNKIGHGEAATWFLAESNAGQATKDVGRVGMEQGIWSMRPLGWLIGEWGAGMLLLLNIGWLALWGGLAALLARNTRIRTGQPLHRGVKTGLWLTLLLPMGVAIATSASPGGSDATALLGLVGAVLLVAAPVVLLKRSNSWRAWGRSFGVALLTLLSCSAMLFLAYLSISTTWAGGTIWNELWGSMSSDTPGNPSLINSSQLMGAFFVLFAPLSLVGISALRARRRRNRLPASVAVIQGLRKNALGVMASLLLVYAAVVGVTLCQEANVSAELNRVIKSEGKYFASLSDQEWPGAIPELHPQEQEAVK